MSFLLDIGTLRKMKITGDVGHCLHFKQEFPWLEKLEPLNLTFAVKAWFYPRGNPASIPHLWLSFGVKKERERERLVVIFF